MTSKGYPSTSNNPTSQVSASSIAIRVIANVIGLLFAVMYSLVVIMAGGAPGFGGFFAYLWVFSAFATIPAFLISIFSARAGFLGGAALMVSFLLWFPMAATYR